MKRKILLTLIISTLFIAPKVHGQYTPGGLFSLARAGNIEGLKTILAKKPDPRLLSVALDAAVIGQKPDAIRLLASHGGDINYVNPDGNSLLMTAIMLKFYTSANTLIELGANPNVMGYRRVYHDYPINWQWTPLMAAAYLGNLELVKLLVENNADIKTKGFSTEKSDLETAADIAAYSGHFEILKYLIKLKSEISGNTVFKTTRSGHMKIVKYLVKKKRTDVNKPGPNRGKTLLMEAAWWGHVDLVKYFIRKKADVNATEENGYTALSEAASNSGKDFPHQLEIIKILIKNGANVRQTESFKLSPLMRAKDPGVISFLIEAGAR